MAVNSVITISSREGSAGTADLTNIHNMIAGVTEKSSDTASRVADCEQLFETSLLLAKEIKEIEIDLHEVDDKLNALDQNLDEVEQNIHSLVIAVDAVTTTIAEKDNKIEEVANACSGSLCRLEDSVKAVADRVSSLESAPKTVIQPERVIETKHITVETKLKTPWLVYACVAAQVAQIIYLFWRG